MERTIQCVCGLRLKWIDETAQAAPVCPSCGQALVTAEVVKSKPPPIPEAPDVLDFDVLANRKAKETVSVRAISLYSPLAIGLAGLMGGILAASILLGLNLRSLKFKGASVVAILFGLIATLVISTILLGVLDLPFGLAAIIPLSAAIGGQLVVGGLLGALAALPMQRRGIARSRMDGLFFGLTLGCGLLVFGAQVAVFYPFSWGGALPTRTAHYGENQRVVYSVDISQEKLGRAVGILYKHGLFQDVIPRHVDVFLLTRKEHVEMRFFVDENTWRTGVFDPVFEDIRRDLAKGPFADVNVLVIVCNNFGKQLRVIS